MKHSIMLLIALLLAPLAALHAVELRTETWTEKWPDSTGQLQIVSVTAEVWTQVFKANLDADGHLHIPSRKKPYHLDGPLGMKSGQKLIAEAKAEIRLKPRTNTCMVRNEQVANLNTKPVPADLPFDTHITIEGGIWIRQNLKHLASLISSKTASPSTSSVCFRVPCVPSFPLQSPHSIGGLTQTLQTP